MNYQIIQPTGHLADYVRYFWILDSDQPYVHRSMADGCAEMIFHYQGTFDELTENEKVPTSLSAIRGPSSTYQVFKTHSHFGIFGIYLYPFALPCLLSVPSAELSNERPDLQTLLGPAGKELEEKMVSATNNTDRLQIATSFLESRLSKVVHPEAAVFHAVQNILQSRGSVNIEELAEQCFVSRRQFERKFRYFAGFSPKAYARIIRFQTAADEYGKRDKSLAQIALECGYYDQSHFANDFKKFSGYCPGTYFYGDATGVEWRDAISEPGV